MKRIIIIASALVIALGIGIGSASAAGNMQQGTLGFSVGVGDSVFSHKAMPGDVVINDVVDISGKYFIQHDMALIVGFGFQTDGGDADATYYSVSGGIRKYLKTDDFAPFIGGKLLLARAKNDNTGFDATVIDLEANFGAEYFFSKNFSLEGAIGLGLGQINYDNPDRDDNYFGTRTVGVKANFYF